MPSEGVSLAISAARSAPPARREEDVSGFAVRGPDHDGGAVDGHGVAELVARRVGGRQFGHLARMAPAVRRKEDVDRAIVTIHGVGSNHERVPVDGHGVAELVARRGVGGDKLELPKGGLAQDPIAAPRHPAGWYQQRPRVGRSSRDE